MPLRILAVTASNSPFIKAKTRMPLRILAMMDFDSKLPGGTSLYIVVGCINAV